MGNKSHLVLTRGSNNITICFFPQLLQIALVFLVSSMHFHCGSISRTPHDAVDLRSNRCQDPLTERHVSSRKKDFYELPFYAAQNHFLHTHPYSK